VESLKLPSKRPSNEILHSAGLATGATLVARYGCVWIKHEDIGGDLLQALLDASTAVPKQGQVPPFAPEACLSSHCQLRLSLKAPVVVPGTDLRSRYRARVPDGGWRLIHTTKQRVGFPSFLVRRALGPATHNMGSFGRPLTAGGSLAPGVKLMDKEWRPQVQARRAAIQHFVRERDSGAASCRLVLGCGAGKTLLMIAIAVAVGRRCIVFSHDTTIQSGIVAEARRFTRGIKVGIIREDQWDVGNEFDIVVASV